MMGPWCTCYPLLYTSGCQITSKFSENVLGWLYYLFSQKKDFLFFFEKSQIMFWGNWMRNPSYMDIFCLANYPADEVLQDVQGVLKICIQTFTSYNTKRLSYLRSMCCKIIITIRVNKEIKNLGMKCYKRVMKQAWPNQFRHI